MKRTCHLCEHAPGKRACQVRDNAPICPVCCATHRNQECKRCRYYAQAQQHQHEKLQLTRPRHFIIEVNPEVEEAVNRALELIEHQQYSQAEQMLTSLQMRYPRNHLIYYGVGTLAAMQGELDRAISQFDQATQLFPYFLEAQFNKAVAYQEKGDIRNMVQAFRGVVVIGDAHDPSVRYALEFLADLEQYLWKSERISLDHYLEGQALFERGVVCFTKKQWNEAIQWFQQTLAITPGHAQPYGNMGLCYGFLGQKALAIEALDKALELDPQYELAMVNRAIIEKLPEGKCLSTEAGRIVEYYREYPLKNRSYLEEFTHHLRALQEGKRDEMAGDATREP